MSPHLIAAYAYELANAFNSFYTKEQVIGSEREAELLALVAAVANTLEIALTLLAIPAPERM